jgi:hypothetical protein
MRLPITVTLVAAALGVGACSASSTGSASSSNSAITDDAGAPLAEGACSQAYWTWVLHTLEPQMARSISEVPESDLMGLVADHPDPKNTADGYSVCWAPLFSQYVVGNALYALHKASVDFGDSSSPSYRSYPLYLSNIAMTPELRRNARAILALRPATMSPTDSDLWMSTYSDVIAETIHPVGIPGLLQYEDVVEPEWVISAPESDYLSMVEQAQAAPSKDGVYGEWMPDFGRWLFGPPPAVSRSFVFNAPWEAATQAESDSYGLAGIQLDGNGVPVLPAAVQSFVTRIAATMPSAVGSDDTGSWWAVYNGRALRALGDLAQNQPIVTQTDALALGVLESVKPANPAGLFGYQTWLDLMVVASSQSDVSWSRRFMGLEPCLDASDLATASASFTAKGQTVPGLSPPHVCAE